MYKLKYIILTKEQKIIFFLNLLSITTEHFRDPLSLQFVRLLML